MRTFNTLVLALATLHPAALLAAPAPQDGTGCFVPAIVFSDTEPFTLTALITDPAVAQRSWPVQVVPRTVSKRETGRPVISNTKIAPSVFQLVAGKLVYDRRFDAEFLPTLRIFPPPLQSFVWGGTSGGRSPAEFYAAYGCDNEGRQILELFDTLPGSSFVVKQVAEGNQVYIKPEENQTPATIVRLQIKQSAA